jgi:hypothetical protein
LIVSHRPYFTEKPTRFMWVLIPGFKKLVSVPYYSFRNGLTYMAPLSEISFTK